MEKPYVLLVDDDADWLRICSKRLPQRDYMLKVSDSVESALRLLSAETAVVVADICMPGASGLGGFELLDTTKALGLDTRVVMITAYAGGLKNIVHDALGRGAHNFVEKKVGFQELDDCILDAIDYWEQRREFRKLLSEECHPSGPEPEPNGPTVHIFLSYAREDEEEVENLYQKLSDARFKPWMDKKDILPGERWKTSIQKAVRRSDFFLVCLSANSIDKRGWIQREIKQALDIWQEKLDSDIYLIPLRLEDCDVPKSLSDFQWVNLFEEDGWTRLVKAIRVGMERRTESTSR